MPSAALERHPDAACDALRGIEASVSRTAAGGLQVAFVLDGNIDRVRIPPPRPQSVVEGLWRHTCCEIFIARFGAPGYREFNLSPSGEWAAYDFTRYREGRLLDDPSLSPGIVVRAASGALRLSASIAVPHGQTLVIGLAAVIEENSGALSYWALRHAPGKPDFHHRDAFALTLAEAAR
ncbi:MAG TPA: DOMON-like domain-containing protein [Burkholderiales bacterium]|nr:DOMON-like domain-containing protein [Burkholderiales bacterium]